MMRFSSWCAKIHLLPMIFSRLQKEACIQWVSNAKERRFLLEFN